ncbi:selection and upkeep of intraepithelial T-cells protein 10-like [Cricetulus griseus]|uniref:Selection and upkeep of intraepithelial T-cells protein 10-like n=1 Tax=Cricetulus griseus TaxID=10029 RepID=A0A9J7GMG7_CRIGR|nr:selection and upkeep of intraepithelial T-cells protein 10-like [Cricetulus griseus]XP_035296314.1 selection and upkeep of intraepithelial T-cells protein 10-like [Cricetulus griseus]
MEPAASCFSGFFMAFLLLQITVPTQATSLDIQINIRVPDAEGILVECTSGSLIPPAEMTWRDSKGNIIPHSSKFDSQDSTGLLYLKSRILLKNRTHGPVTCSIYNETTNQEKKKSIVLPDVLFKPEYMSLISNKTTCPVIYLSFILALHFLKGILVCYFLRKKWGRKREGELKLVYSKRMRLCYEFVCECLPLGLYIGFLPLYLMFRSRASILDDAYPLYSSWIWDVCIILVVMMTFFTVLILFLLCTLNTREQESQEIEIRPLRHIPHDSTQRRAQLVLGRYREETMQLQGNYEEDNFGQHQEDCEEAIFNALQPLRLDCNLNRET